MTNYTNGPTGADRELYGDLIDDVQRWVQPGIDQRTAEIEQQLRETQREVRQQRIERALDNDPVTRDRWRKQNHDEAFLAWLDQEHTLSGERRRDILRKAESYGNADVIVNLFKTFALEQTPGRVDEHKQLPYQNPQTRAPSGSTKRWRREEIKAFYDACRRGEYLKKETERARIEADIIAAAREGRVDRLPMVLSKGTHT